MVMSLQYEKRLLELRSGEYLNKTTPTPPKDSLFNKPNKKEKVEEKPSLDTFQQDAFTNVVRKNLELKEMLDGSV